MPRLGVLLVVLCLVGSGGGAVAAGRRDPRDALLAQRAERVGRNTATRHLSPEGLLAYSHRWQATPAQLSHDTVRMADTGIWTGCYAASVACRYAVTRDPEALALARRVAAGLDLLSRATGVEGCISRAAGYPIPGEKSGDHVVPSPLGGGLAYRDDPSRDTLSGVVLGWECLARFVDDPGIRADAARNLGAIARRLFHGGMKLRNPDGKVTTYGLLEHKSGLVFENGMHSAIGLATILAGATWSLDKDLWDAWRHLEKEGWVDSLDATYTFLDTKITSASNMNMVHLALLVIALEGQGKAKRLAMEALRDYRRKTHGWQNGSYLGVALLAGQQVGRDETVDEIRETLLRMPAEEAPYVGTTIAEQDHVVPIDRRPVNVWAWKLDPHKEEFGREQARLDPRQTYCRADWLFAYWLARAAGELDPGP